MDARPWTHRGMLERSARLVADGLEIVPQVTCRPLNFELDIREPFLLESMSIFEPVSAANSDGKKRIYAPPAFRAAFKERARSAGRDAFAGGWSRTVVSYSSADPTLEERSVSSLAAERNIDPVDLVLDLSLETDLVGRLFRSGRANHP